MMPEKKDPGRFTIRFNYDDPMQKSVVELLNQQGRLKAQFLTGAVLHYIHCPETPELRPVPVLDKAEIEKIVLAILDGRYPQPQPTLGDAPSVVEQLKEVPAPNSRMPEDLLELFGPDGMAAITNTVAAFQRE